MRVIIGFSKARSKLAIASVLIRLVEKTPYSHIFMQVDDVVVHANHVGVSVIYLPTFLEKNVIVSEYNMELAEDQINHVLDTVKPHLGKKYGTTQLIGCLLSLVLKLKKNPFTKGFICSEFIAMILLDLMWVDIKKDINLVTPKDIQEALDAR